MRERRAESLAGDHCINLAFTRCRCKMRRSRYSFVRFLYVAWHFPYVVAIAVLCHVCQPRVVCSMFNHDECVSGDPIHRLPWGGSQGCQRVGGKNTQTDMRTKRDREREETVRRESGGGEARREGTQSSTTPPHCHITI